MPITSPQPATLARRRRDQEGSDRSPRGHHSPSRRREQTGA
jgi:hypothetical protein